MLCVTYSECYIKALYAECRYTECHYAEYRGASSLTSRHYTWLGRLAKDKHSSLLQTFLNYGR